MSYTFNDIVEFNEFVSDSFERGDYAQEMENFNKGVNTISNDSKSWHWLEGGKLYLVKSNAGNFFILYQHPSKGFKQHLWFYTPHNNDYRTWNMGSFEKSWVREYLVLDSHSLSFMNWINENPFEVKQ